HPRLDSFPTLRSSDLVEEAFHYGFIAHRLANHKKRFSLAETAADWARQKHCPALQVSLLMDLAESEASLRNTIAADTVLRSARRSEEHTLNSSHQIIS